MTAELKTWHDYILSGKIDDLAEEQRLMHTGSCYSFVKNISIELPEGLDFAVHEFWGLSGKNYNEKRFPGAHGSELAIHVLDHRHELTKMVMKELELTMANLRITRQRPGKISTFHVDINRNFYIDRHPEETKHILPEDTCKYIIFPHDQRPGEFFGFGKESITWKAGDVFTWPWYMDHGGANSGYQDRFAMVVIGY